MTYDGRLLEVEVLGRGTSATADVAVGAVEVPVEDLTEFSDEGGRCEIDGVQYDYSGIIEADDGSEGGTLVLADPLSVGVAEADPVLVVVGDQAATDAWAVVDLGSPRQDVADDGAYGVEPDPDTIDGPDVGDVVRVPLSFSQRLAYREGVYEPPLPVQVAADLSSVIDVPGVVPVIDGAMIDPDTLPSAPPSGPKDPPASTPALIVTPGPDFFVLRVENGDPEWAGVQIEYHAALADEDNPAPFTPTPGDPATLIGTTAGVLVSNRLPSGEAYSLSASYAFVAIARNAVGYAPTISNQATAALDPSAITDIVAAQIIAGFILTGRVQFGQGYIDADEGLVLPQPDGTVTRFPVDGLTPATVSGFLIANGMVMKDGAYFYGLSQISGRFLLTAGVGNPSVKPDVAWDWDAITPAGQPSGTGAMVLDTTGTKFITFTASYSNSIVVETLNVDGSARTDRDAGGAGLKPMSATRIGSTYFVLGTDSTRPDSWWVYKYTAASVEGTGALAKTGEFPVGTCANEAAIGTDGTSILLAYVSRNRWVSWLSYNPATGAVVQANSPTSVQLAAGAPTRFVGRGAFGEGGRDDLYIAIANTDNTVYAFNPATGAAASDSRTFKVRGLGGTIAKMGWDGTYFYAVDAQQNTNYRKSGSYASGASSYQAAYTWYDGDSAGTGTHETAGSPIRTGVAPARARAVITARPAPHADVTDPTQHDKANLIRIYGRMSPSPLELKATLPVGVTALRLDVVQLLQDEPIGVPALPTVSTFASSNVAPGVVEAEAADAKGPRVSLKGDGSWRLGDLSGDATGKVTFPDTGWITLASTVSGTGVQYRVLSGVFYVWLSGSGTITNQAVVANGGVPAAYRPSSQISGGGLVSNTPGALSVTPAGAVWATTTDHSEKTGVHGAMLSYPLGT